MGRDGEGHDDAFVIRPAEADPGGGDEELHAGRPRRPMPRWLLLAGVCVLAGGVVLAALHRDGRQRAAAPRSSPSAAPVASPSPGITAPQIIALDLGETTAVDLSLAGGMLFVLTTGPPRLAKVEPGIGTLQAQVAVPPDARWVAADADVVWLVGSGGAGTVAYAYDVSTLTTLGAVRVPGADVAAAAVLDGALYLATDRGVYVTPSLRPYGYLVGSVIRLAGAGAPTRTIVADPAQHRLLAVTERFTILVIRPPRGEVAAVSEVGDIAPASIMLTGAGAWVTGFGRPGGMRIGRLDERTLGITPVGPNDADAPQGADGWPGESVFWVKYPYGDEVTCRDGHTGVVLGSFPNVEGPVVSVRGAAYGLRAGQVVRVPTTASACPG